MNPLVKSLVIIITLKTNFKGTLRKLKLILKEMIQWSGGIILPSSCQTGKEDLAAIPASTAPSERVFSTAKTILRNDGAYYETGWHNTKWL